MVARDHCSGVVALALVLLLATCTPAAAQLVNPRLRVTLPGVLGSVRGSSCPNSNAGASYRFLGVRVTVSHMEISSAVPASTTLMCSAIAAPNSDPACAVRHAQRVM